MLCVVDGGVDDTERTEMLESSVDVPARESAGTDSADGGEMDR